MALFTIRCTTCRTRLGVRNRAVIGQILACPQCGSMVLVEPSEEASRRSANPAAAAPLAMSAEPAGASQAPAERTDVGARRASEQGAPPESSSAPGEPGGAAAPEPTTFAIPAATAPSMPPAPPPPPSLPNADMTSSAAGQWRHAVLASGAAIAGVALAVGVFGLSIYHASPSRNADSQTARAQDVAPATTAPAIPRAPADRGPEEAAIAVETAPEPPRGAREMRRVESSVSADRDDLVVASDGKATGPSQAEGEPIDTEDDVPPDFAPRSDRAGDLGGPVEASSSAGVVRATTPKSLPADSLTSAGGFPAARAGPGAGSAPRALPPLPSPQIADVAAGLAYKLQQVEFPGTPLADFIQFLSDLSAIPITLDLDALARLRVARTAPIQIHQTDTTVEDVLAASLDQLGLAYVVTPGQVTVTAPAPPQRELPQRMYEVGDLTQGAPERVASLADVIAAVVAPDSWSLAGGKGEVRRDGQMLAIRQSPQVHFEVRRLLARLRLARGLPALGDVGASQGGLESHWERARSVLATGVSLNLGQPTRLQSILDRLGETAGIRIFINWRALGEVGLTPPVETTLTVAERPLSEALDELLRPMELSCRIVDEATLEVTTPRALESRIDVEFYSVGDRVGEGSDGGRSFLGGLRRRVGERWFREAGGPGALRLDSESGRLIAALPQPQQIALEKFLER